MRNNLYICNAKQQQDLLGSHTNIAYCVSSCGTSAPSSRGCLATISRRVRSLFVHTKRKTCFTMPNNNKQATKAKYSNLSQKIRTTIVGTLFSCALPLIIGVCDSKLYSIAGIALLVLSVRLFDRWNIDTKDYSNEFFNNDVR